MSVSYGGYLQLDRLLDLQRLRSDPAEHDEMLFIVIHQVYELWFKQVLHDVDRLCALQSAGDLFGSIATVKRVRTIFKTLVGQLDILETMTLLLFAAFPARLETSSGFQSMQFRELEFVLGYKRVEMLQYLESGTVGFRRLEQRLDAPSLIDHFYEFLATRGVSIPAALRDKPVRESTVASPELQRDLLVMFREQQDVAILFEMLLDLDEGMQEWRYRHVKLVERTIGNKRGTGDSLGVQFLKKSLFLQVFPDLWAIRHEL